MNAVDQVEADIKNLKIQGATNVALAVLDVLEKTTTDVKEAGKRLAYARPTEPLAQNALRYILSDRGVPVAKRVQEYRSFITEAKKAIVMHGTTLLRDGGTYLTHCHSSTVTSIFITAHNQGKRIKVITTETRPLFQGRITVTELLSGGIADVNLIVDAAAASVLSDPSHNVSAVFIGSDLLSEGGLVNKIGSLTVVLAARAEHIPIFCVSTLLKYDPLPLTRERIEMRNPAEIWPDAPKGLTIVAPAFDFTPYQNDVRVVCEEGIIEGNAVKEAALRRYPFLSYG